MLNEFITGLIILVAYYLTCATIAFIIRHFLPVPREVFRKTLHIIALGSIFIWVYFFTTWWISALAALMFITLLLPILTLAERLPAYSEMLIQRKPGEIKRSVIAIFFMFALLITVCWGW